MQNIATHELAHGMGVNSYLYTQGYDSSGNVVAKVSDYVSTWDSVPEPTSGVLIMLSLMGLAWRRRRA